MYEFFQFFYKLIFFFFLILFTKICFSSTTVLQMNTSRKASNFVKEVEISDVGSEIAKESLGQVYKFSSGIMNSYIVCNLVYSSIFIIIINLLLLLLLLLLFLLLFSSYLQIKFKEFFCINF